MKAFLFIGGCLDGKWLPVSNPGEPYRAAVWRACPDFESWRDLEEFPKTSKVETHDYHMKKNVAGCVCFDFYVWERLRPEEYFAKLLDNYKPGAAK